MRLDRVDGDVEAVRHRGVLINDSGQLREGLVGRIPPHRSEPHGRGLLLVNELCDLVEMPTGGIGTETRVRLQMGVR